METVVNIVRDLNEQKRSAAQHLVEHELREDQQLIIQVSDAADDASGRQPDEAPWSNLRWVK